MGNVRLSYSDADLNGTIDPSTEIIEEKNYYPFGLEHQGYNNVVVGAENNYQTYNGKELEKELGINWTDYGARRYMADIGRWPVIDNKAEKYYEFSPYNYALNNPIVFVDPDGQKVIWGEGLSAKRKEEIGYLVTQMRMNSEVFNKFFEKLHSSENIYAVGGTEGESQLGFDAVVIPNSKLGDMIGTNKNGVPVWEEGTPGATMDIYFGQLKKDNLKLEDVLAEEFVHLYQQEFYVSEGSFDYEKKPQGANIEYEAKAISGIIKRQAGIPLNNNATGWAERKGIRYSNNPKRLNNYSQDMQNWINLPEIQKTSYANKPININRIPSLLISIITRE